MTKFTSWSITAILLTIFLSPLKLSGVALLEDESAKPLVADILNKWKSSDRDIEAKVLLEESWPAVGSKSIIALANLSQSDLLAALVALQINKGQAENLLRMQEMQKCFSSGKCPWPAGRDFLINLQRPQLDKLVANLPEAPARELRQGEFDYLQYERERAIVKKAGDNDWYNFRVPAAMFTLNMHNTHRSIYHVFTRGHNNRAFWLAGGINETINFIKHLRFTEREIQFLKEHPQYINIDPEFWNYLRTWKFSGNIRAVQTGTVIFENEPIMEIEANPIDHHLIESLILPILAEATKSLTMGGRITLQMDGRDWVDGSGRRGGAGFINSLNAVYGGAAGTSMMTVARLFPGKIIPYGSQPHAWIDYFESELDAFIAYLKIFPDSTLISDTHNIVQGIKQAIRAGGTNLAGVRIDSLIENLTLGDTVKVVRKLFEFFGYDTQKIGVSNRLTVFELYENPSSKAPFNWALVGNAIVSPEDAPTGNMVYKFASVTFRDESGEFKTFDRTKTSKGKEGIPGSVQVYRTFKTETKPHGRSTKEVLEMTGDILAARDEIIENARPLLAEIDYSKPLVSDPVAVKAYVSSQLATLPPELKDPHARSKTYSVVKSPNIDAKLRTLKKSLTPHKRKAVGVVFSSFDPLTLAHELMIDRARELYDLEQIVLVPAAQKESLKFTSAERVKAAKDFVARLENLYPEKSFAVSELESSGRSPYAYQTLRELKQSEELDIPADADIHIICGDELFETVPTWKNAEELLGEYSWIVATRDNRSNLNFLPSNLIPNYKNVQQSPRHLRKKGRYSKFIQMVELKTGAISSRIAKARFEAVDTIAHQVDAQLTFWEAYGGFAAGPLAVPGSTAITSNIEILALLFKISSRVKSVSSADAHFEVEVAKPDQFNPEFKIFGPHGMKYRSGAVGAGRIPAVRDQYALSRQLVIPNYRQSNGINTDRDELKEAPFDLEAHSASILDPDIEIIIEKNGRRKEIVDGKEVEIAAYDWGINKHAESIVKMIKAKRVVIYGVATDWCVVAAALRYRKLGFEVWLATDAIAHIFEKEDPAFPASQFGNKEKAMREMAEAGVIFKTTKEVVEEYLPSLTPDQRSEFFNKAPKSGCSFDLAQLAGISSSAPALASAGK